MLTVFLTVVFSLDSAEAMTSSETPTETKILVVSWYGPRFHGKKMANGQRFDQHQLTAAHKDRPFGTRIKLTNPDNGLSCMVTITDRGPYVRNRHLDISRAAAERLQIIEDGVARLQAEVFPPH